MTGQQVIDFFENLVNDAPDVDFEIDLFNDAKDVIEAMRDWEILKNVNTSLSWATSDTYLTAHSFASFSPKILTPVAVWAGDDEIFGTPFEKRLLYKDSGRHFYIDWRNENIYFTGTTSAAKTISFFYVEQTTDLSAGNLSLVTLIVWPAKFHKLIAFVMAELFSGVDADDITFRSAGLKDKRAQLILDGMIHWDDRLKRSALDHSIKERRRVISQDQIDIDDLP